jgi:hypothetical protein
MPMPSFCGQAARVVPPLNLGMQALSRLPANASGWSASLTLPVGGGTPARMHGRPSLATPQLSPRGWSASYAVGNLAAGPPPPPPPSIAVATDTRSHPAVRGIPNWRTQGPGGGTAQPPAHRYDATGGVVSHEVRPPPPLVQPALVHSLHRPSSPPPVVHQMVSAGSNYAIPSQMMFVPARATLR